MNVLVFFTFFVRVLFSNVFQSNTVEGEFVTFTESNGFVEVEAENFLKQSETSKRAWYVVDDDFHSDLADPDPPHFRSASGGIYLECLPDTRVTHDDTLVPGENFSNQPGEMAVLHYRVFINNPGRYYVWVRAFSTGTEDNGIHVGLNNTWPESGRRMQWCEGKNEWTWASKQRTDEQHCGVPELIFLDIDKAGHHEILFSMREDGFEFDKFILTRNYKLPESVLAGQ